MCIRALRCFVAFLMVMFLGIPIASAGADPPELPGSYQLFESTWNDSGNVGPVVIAINLDDKWADGKIWFPMEGTCTWGRWGTIVPGSLRIDESGHIVPTSEKVEMMIDGECGPATATFEPDQNRLRVVRVNRPSYTFYINLKP